MKYTLFIDESGDIGIDKVRTANDNGASPYMTMGGVLVPNKNLDDLRAQLSSFRNLICNKSYLHCRSLSHEQKVRFCDFLKDQQILCFGVISHKESLGTYRDDINRNPSFYYNKCTQYLLERLGMFLNENKIDTGDVDIVFEEIKTLDYTKMKNLILSCQRNPHHANTHFLKKIDANKIFIKQKNEEILLEMSDLVAHSLYKCVDGGPIDVIETRYLDTIVEKFYGGSDLIGKGLYLVHSLDDLKLRDQGKAFFEAFKNTPTLNSVGA